MRLSKKQPSTPIELEQVLSAFEAACLDCFRYSGKDREILRELENRGFKDRCDYPLPSINPDI